MQIKSAEPGSPLAAARCAAHRAFDPIWQSGEMSRSAAYRWLAMEMGVAKADCHMLHFNEVQCNRVVRLCEQRDFAKLVSV